MDSAVAHIRDARDDSDAVMSDTAPTPPTEPDTNTTSTSQPTSITTSQPATNGLPLPEANTAAHRKPDQSQGQPSPAQSHTKTHAPSGYTYTRDEDAPGWSWKNKRAQEEMNRALRDVEARNTVIGMRYGDPALIADANTPWEKIL